LRAKIATEENKSNLEKIFISDKLVELYLALQMQKKL
jgi:hypothetical protein